MKRSMEQDAWRALCVGGGSKSGDTGGLTCSVDVTVFTEWPQENSAFLPGPTHSHSSQEEFGLCGFASQLHRRGRRGRLVQPRKGPRAQDTVPLNK